ncbi:MAG: bifunctional alpha,alpha-trehalose-phosphate synthase (UDP-forming)/trehalose-phosphatase [Acidobacteria bacterium]|nr:bifunctional alpha,alpha-trehalose-phosphate synthase (UDP-forming)/trehalose-phosphatase [Acidobacteriota bacterium]
MIPKANFNAKRMIIVSNRLPFTIKGESDDLRFIPSVGGLSTGLSSYLEQHKNDPRNVPDYRWVGWPGNIIEPDWRNEIKARSLSEFNALPVFLSEKNISNYYHGFCNRTIWPLFHYFQVYTKYDEEYWKHYVQVNKIFYQTLLELLEPDDVLWVHDFHLMLLPKMVRKKMPSVTIGFTLHIPFPNFEIYRLLPRKWRKDILEGLLGSDLIGFHTNDYKQDFLRCIIRILGHESNMGEIVIGDRIVKTDSFPMGIDYRKYHNGATSPKTQQESLKIRERLWGARIILSIDRLDYTKGIANRLEAFQTFLESYPRWIGKVVLILIVVPSRVEVEHYGQMRNHIESLVGKINGKFGNPSWTPIIYMSRPLTFSPLVAMYAASDIALITPLRDGMNLIAKEYLACRADKTGVLVLSEMAGASKELVEAIIINPNNREEIAEALAQALEMPEDEQVQRNSAMQIRLKHYDVARWASDFIEELQSAQQTRQKHYMKILSPQMRQKLLDQYRNSQRRLLLLDYDGTLVPFKTRPQDAVPDASLLRFLAALAEDPRNEVVIISGRDKGFLESCFHNLPISMVAEHGAWTKMRGEKWQSFGKDAHDWTPKIKPLLRKYVDRVAGSFIEEKDFALVWHYRGSDLEPGKLAAQELKDHLLELTANSDVHILQGNKTVEIRPAGVNKGTASVQLLSTFLPDFTICIGDDITDEDMFAALPESAYTIHVGLGGTEARFSLAGTKEARELLKSIAETTSSADTPTHQTKHSIV